MNRFAPTVLALLGPAVIAGCTEQASQQHDILAAVVAQPQVTQSYAMPVHATASAATSGCDNSPGPYVTVSGALALGGLGTRLTFTNNQKGTHSYSVQAQHDVTVIPAGQAITIPKQPVLGGAGGNPFIWLQLVDDKGAPLTGEIYLGRCVQGLMSLAADFTLPSSALAVVFAGDCTNNPGPYITLSGTLTLNAGVSAKLIFRNNDNPVGGPHEADVTTSVKLEILPPGTTIQFPKQPVLGGVGGNPWIYLQFLTGGGATIGPEYLVGRCVQLG